MLTETIRIQMGMGMGMGGNWKCFSGVKDIIFVISLCKGRCVCHSVA